MQISDALDAYAVQLRADGRAPCTIEQAERYVRLLAHWLRENKAPLDIAQIRHEHVAQFLASRMVTRRHDGCARSPTSSNVLRSSIRCFFAFVEAAGYSERNAARLVRRARCGTRPPRALPADDCQRLLRELAKDDESARRRRDHVLFALMLATGIRIGSATGLDVRDLDLDEGVALLRTFKGGRVERVFLPPRIVALLRAHVGKRKGGPLFESRPGKAIDPRQVRRRLGDALKAAGVERQATPHTLRHSFATELLARTGNVRLVQRALGHKSISSTIVYAELADEAVRRAVCA